MHQNVDKIRDETEERREMHQKVDNIRNQTEERKEFQRNYQKNLRFENFLKSIEFDTGFNIICCCCAEYKSRYACTGIQVLSPAQQKKYLINSKLVVSKDGKRYVCKVCRAQIDAKKIPKKSEKIHLKYTNIPAHLKNYIKSVTNYSKVIKRRKLSSDREHNVEQSLELNKLEAHLLKLTIPFVRIAHCPRGTYFKVRGSLILISADISHSLSRILPQGQNILPVCFKRKLEYSGNYLEEVIDKNKVRAYFDFYKANNPLYKDISLKEDLIDQFETECTEYADKFQETSDKLTEESLKGDTDENSSLESESESEENDEMDKFGTFEEFEEDTKSAETYYFRDQSTVFCNKYEEDVMVPTVANKLANIIVSIEINNDIDSEIYQPDKADINDEIDLDEVDMFMDNFENDDADLHKNQDDVNFQQLKDELHEAQDDSEDNEIENVAKASNDHFSNIISRLEKISVAPGEKGKFENWGDDVFLEEKCFPELFPFGVGGYLSMTIGDDEQKMGFAQYIKHRVLSADSKYRRNSAYIFFLLLVKELIQLKRCKQTYLRQATKIPNLTKESMINVKKEDLARYNRSFQVFKTMRGTSMYYEEAKKNVMAVLRQNGSPSLFLTLSCAEYSWEGLLREILETVKGRKVTTDEINQLTAQQRNKLVSENVVQSTLHFQKRIEKELKLMQYPKFLDDSCPYAVSSYFYRVEFQQRGAPHIHCLLWLEDEEGNPAPTFWNCESEDKEKKNDTETRIKKIEDIAMMLISASEDDAKCDDHQKELHEKKNEESEKDCFECFSVKHDFEKCPKHNFSMQYSCQDCELQRKLINDFQIHNHTFTCKKRRKTITVRKNEGHGRLDGKCEGPKISDYVECRFNFPHFPLNRTKLILGLPKDLDETELSRRKLDFKKIKKFLIRQTYSENKDESESFKAFKKTSFIQFLFNVGMFHEDKTIEQISNKEKKAGYQRYVNALSVSVRGTGAIFLKRNPKDVFTNNFNRRIMSVHKANHDIQIVIDQVCI